jgi:hypothetical protein
VDGGTSVTFSATDLPGVYNVIPIFDEDATPGPSGATPRPTATAAPSPSASASASPGGVVAPVDPGTPSRFVVALFDVRESTITPNDGRDLVALGGDPSAEPGASPATGGGAAEARPTTRDELWIPIILLVLVVLSIEWAVYHRDALARIRRSLGTRLGRAPGGNA